MNVQTITQPVTDGGKELCTRAPSPSLAAAQMPLSNSTSSSVCRVEPELWAEWEQHSW